MVDTATYERKRKFAGNVFASPVPCFSRKLSTKDNLKLRWMERISSSHLPSANFIFEVTFPEVDAMRFEAIARSIFYSEDSDDFMECYIVKEVMPFFANVIYPGDILLRVNGQSLLRKSVNGEFIDPQKSSSCFENIASAALTSANATPSFGVTIRFMRTGSTSLNFTPSPAELNLFQVDKHIAAKFSVVKVTPTVAAGAATATANATTNATTNAPSPQQWSIQLSYLDQQLPSSISQMMLGGSVTWDHTLLLNRSACAAAAQCTHGGILPSTAGTHSGSTGPGTFSGPGLSSSLADSWVVPTGSVYTPRTLTSSSDTSTGNSGGIGGISGDSNSVSSGGADVVATAVAALMATSAGTNNNNSIISATTAATANPDTAEAKTEPALVTNITQTSGSVHQLDSTTLSTANASGQNMYGTSGAALTVGVPLSAKHGQSKGNGGWVAVLKLFVSVPQVPPLGTEKDSVNVTASVEEQHYSLGRFDKEADAHLALQQAYLEVQEHGSFRPRYYMKRLTAALIAAHPPPVAVAPKPIMPMQHGALGLNKGVGSYNGLNNNALHNNAPSKYLAGLQQSRNVHSTTMLAGNNTLGGLNNNANSVSVGETVCGFNNVAKVVMALAPAPGSHGVHGSSSSGNISSLAYQKK